MIDITNLAKPVGAGKESIEKDWIDAE